MLMVQIMADCFICGHPLFLRHLRSVFEFKQILSQTVSRQLPFPAPQLLTIPPGC